MAFNYDKLYGETRNALGAPTPIFVGFFDRYTKSNARVLDIGCGQGRDALFIARRGHRVLGVDISPNGISDMCKTAQAEGLPVEGIVADITTFVPEGMFDIILIDRTLHMLAAAPRLRTLTRLLDHVAAQGWLLIADEVRNIAAMQQVISDYCQNWRIETAKGGTLFLQRD